MEHNINIKEQKATTQVVIISSFMTAFMGSSLNLAIPNMGEYFSVSATGVGWLITAYMLATAAFSVPFGKLADTTGRRRIFVGGVLLFCISCFASALAWNMEVMLFFRVLQGIAGAMMVSTNTAIIIVAYPPAQRGKAIGKMVAGVYVGLSSGPVIGGIVNHWLGWQSIFIFSGVIGLYAFIVALKKLPKQENLLQEKGRDVGGNILYIAMIVLVMYGFSNIKTNVFAIPILIAGVVCGVIFVLVELRAKNPVVNVRIFAGNSAYSLSNLAALLNYSATVAIGYFMSIYIQVCLGYSSQIAGILLIAQPLVMAVLSPKMGKLSDKIPPYKLATIGMAICTVCLIFFATVSSGTYLAAIVAGLLVTGFGISVFSSPNMNAIMACVDKADYGVAGSILATMRTLGQVFGMAIITLVIAVNMGNASLEAAPSDLLIRTMRIGFIIFAIICAIGALMSLKRKGTKK